MIKEEVLKQKVEEMGVFFEGIGRTPIQGRIFAYLLLSEPPHRSFDDIREFVQASKSTVSNAINSLQKEKTVTYRTFPGDRKRYFYINMENWLHNSMESVNSLTYINRLVEDAISLRNDDSYKKFNDGLRKLLKFQKYLEKSIQVAVEKWKKDN